MLMDDVRNSAVAALNGRTIAKSNVSGPRDWPTRHDEYPAVIVRTPEESGASKGRFGVPEFDTTVTLDVVGRVECLTVGQADTDSRLLASQIKDAILRNGAFIRNNNVQQFPSFTTRVGLSAEGGHHIGEAVVSITIEVFEVYEPIWDADGDLMAPGMEGMNIHVDLASPFDQNGTYPAPTEPAYTPPSAPRSIGPDGRDEAAMSIDLPQ